MQNCPEAADDKGNAPMDIGFFGKGKGKHNKGKGKGKSELCLKRKSKAAVRSTGTLRRDTFRQKRRARELGDDIPRVLQY